MGLGVGGLGSGVWGLGFGARVENLSSKVCSFEVQGCLARLSRTWFGVLGFVRRVSCSVVRVQASFYVFRGRNLVLCDCREEAEAVEHLPECEVDV